MKKISKSTDHALRPLAVGTSLALALLAQTPAVLAESKTINVDIHAQKTSDALVELANSANIQIILPQNLGATTNSPAIAGDVTVEQALKQLLGNTGLAYSFASENMVIIKAKENNESENGGEQSAKKQEQDVDEEVIVTGSRIARVSSQLAANVIVLSNRELLASGETTLEGALRQLPQNIFGASPVGAGVSDTGMSFNGAINISGASSINLRGLGGESTLVLIDGQRAGKSGVFGGISDITGIPLRSVERVEIMLDGASSIYGSDAVGGVVNIITKKDFEGGEVTYEYASSQLGGFEEHVLTASSSWSWGSGRVRGIFERFQRSNLDGAERPNQITYSSGSENPGKLIGFSAFFFRKGTEYFTYGELLSQYSFSEIAAMMNSNELVRQDVNLPPDQDGKNLSREDLIFTDVGGIGAEPDTGLGISLLPRQLRNNLQVGFDQELQLFGQDVTLLGNFYYSERKTYAADGAFVFGGRIPADHPDNPLPGSTVDLVWQLPDWADRHHQTDQKVSRWNLSLDGGIGDDWHWNLSVGQTRDTIDSLYFNEQIHWNSPEFEQLRDNGLNILAGDLFAANSPELLEGLIAPPRDTMAVNTESTAEIIADGAVFNLPGGDVHVAVGGAWRQEGLESGSRKGVYQAPHDEREIGSVARYSTPREYENTVVSRNQTSAFVELLVPVVSSDNQIPGIRRLNLTGSTRYDSYQRQGSDSTWSLGMIWSPVDQVTFKANHSTSYVVPTFRDQLIPARIIDFTEHPAFAPLGRPYNLIDAEGNPTGEIDYQGISISGGNPDLEPETASTSTAGVEIAPDAFPGFTFKATWHETVYRNRIGSPPQVREYNYISGLGNVFYAGSGYDTKYGDTLYRNEEGLLVWDRRTVNTALVENAGIDYQLNYNRDTDYGQFFFTANVGYTSKYNTVQQAGDEPLNQVKSVGFQSRSVIPAYRYSTQLHWYHRGLSASLNASTSSKTESLGQRGSGEYSIVKRITKAPINVSLVMVYDFDEGDLFTAPAWLQGTEVSLKVPRLLNDTTEYEMINATTGEPYEYRELNANVSDPIGRMFHVSLTKRF